MRKLYGQIDCVGFEYSQAYGAGTTLVPVSVYVLEHGAGRWQAQLSFPGGPRTLPPRAFPILDGLQKHQDAFRSAEVSAANFGEAHRKLRAHFKWHMLYHRGAYGRLNTSTPSSRATLDLPDEFCILMAFFHLGNVVRYDPQRLEQLMDSRAAPMVEALRRHGTLRFLVQFWSFVTQKQIALQVG
jgi:hypothetical protein